MKQLDRVASKDAPKKSATDRKPKAVRWAELLEAAADIFYKKGYEATSLQDIADQVGILKGSIYYYIETKQDLLNQLLREVHAAGIANLRRLSTMEGTSLQILRVMIEDHILYICSNLSRTTVYLHELGNLSAEQKKAIVGEHEFRDEFMRVIIKAQNEGLILPELDPKLTAQVLLGSINSVYGWYRSNRGQSAQRVSEHVGLTSLRGLATPRGIRALSASESANVKTDAKR